MTTVTNMKFASMAFFTALSFIWYSEAFVVPRLVVSPATLSTNKQILSTAPPQHARVTALRDDPKGIVDVVFNSIPLGVLFIAAATERENRKEVFALQERALATWKAAQEAAIAAEKESRKEAIAAEKASWENAFLQQKNAIAAVRARGGGDRDGPACSLRARGGGREETALLAAYGLVGGDRDGPACSLRARGGEMLFLFPLFIFLLLTISA